MALIAAEMAKEEFDLILQLLKFFKNKNLDLDFLIGKNSSISEEQNLIEKFMEDYEIYQKTKSNFNQKNFEKIYEILEFIYLNKDFYFLENLNFSKIMLMSKAYNNRPPAKLG